MYVEIILFSTPPPPLPTYEELWNLTTHCNTFTHYNYTNYIRFDSTSVIYLVTYRVLVMVTLLIN